MLPPTTRLNYFDHQFLRVDDFADEQAYHLGMRRAHNRLLHSPGVAQGLAVTHGGSTLTVGAGVALDGEGREIVLKEPVELGLPANAQTAWVTIAYAERRTEPTTETGAAGDRRCEEVPAVQVDPAPPADPEIRLVLARVTLAAGRVTGVDDGEAPAHRRVAGPAPGAALEVRSLAVQGSAAIGGALAVERTLSVGGAGGGAALNLPGGRVGGDLRVGTGGNQLGVDVEVTGAAAGTARLRAEGAAPRLVLGAAGADVMTVTGTGVGIGAEPATGVTLNVGGALSATEVRQGGTPVVSSQWSAAPGGIAYDRGNAGVGVTEPRRRLHVKGAAPVALFESTEDTAYIQLVSRTGMEERVEFCNRPDRASIWVTGTGDALNVYKASGAVAVPGSLAAGTLVVKGGDLKVGAGANHLNVGVVVSGAAAGTARLRAEGAEPRLILGAAGADVLTVSGTAVGIGVAPAAGVALSVNGVLDATELRQNGVPLANSQWSPATEGIVYTGGRVGVGTSTPRVPLHVIGTRVRLENAEGDRYLDLRTDGSELDLHATGGALFVHTGHSGEALHLNAFGGNVGVGTGMEGATARLQVAGGNGDVDTTEGDFKVGDDTHRLKVGVTTTGKDAGDVRMRAVGGTGRLMIGAGTTDVLTVQSGRVGIGVAAPGSALDVGDQVRLRSGSSTTNAGVWLYQNGSDRAFIGMNGENRLGLFGSAGPAGAGLNMDVTTGNVGINTAPAAVGVAALAVAGNVNVTGRVTDTRIREEVASNAKVQLTSTRTGITEPFYDIPAMELNVKPAVWAKFLIRFQMGGIQIQVWKAGQAAFQLLVNGRVEAFTLMEFHNDGWELRGVTLERMLVLAPGITHNVKVKWNAASPSATAQTGAVLTGCFYNDTRTLMVIEL